MGKNFHSKSLCCRRMCQHGPAWSEQACQQFPTGSNGICSSVLCGCGSQNKNAGKTETPPGNSRLECRGNNTPKRNDPDHTESEGTATGNERLCWYCANECAHEQGTEAH